MHPAMKTARPPREKSLLPATVTPPARTQNPPPARPIPTERTIPAVLPQLKMSPLLTTIRHAIKLTINPIGNIQGNFAHRLPLL